MSQPASPRPRIADRLAPFGTNIFTTITALANQHQAVNLSQGFPDFDGPEFIRQAAAEALLREPNQYAPMPGVPALRRAIAERFTRDTGLPVGFWRMALRQTIGQWVAVVICYLGLIWAIFDANKQGWHDKIAKTLVVSTK